MADAFCRALTPTTARRWGPDPAPDVLYRTETMELGAMPTATRPATMASASADCWVAVMLLVLMPVTSNSVHVALGAVLGVVKSGVVVVVLVLLALDVDVDAVVTIVLVVVVLPTLEVTVTDVGATVVLVLMVVFPAALLLPVLVGVTPDRVVVGTPGVVETVLAGVVEFVAVVVKIDADDDADDVDDDNDDDVDDALLD